MKYNEMFDRNIGVFAKEEQQKLKTLKVAIIGCGGMGGVTAQIVVRTGIENITVADPDIFNVVNINNQFNAFLSTMGKNKAAVVASTIKDINPSSKVEVYEEGLTQENVGNLVEKVDIIFDCVDYNELYYSYILNKEARSKSKFTLAPQAIGYGCSVLIFDPSGVSFNEYLGLEDGMTKEQVDAVRIAQTKYAPITTSYIDPYLAQKVIGKEIPIPNIALAQTLAASIMVSEAIFILLKKRKPICVPEIIAIDLLDKKYLA